MVVMGSDDLKSALRKDLIRRRMSKILEKSISDGATRDEIVAVVDEHFIRETLQE